jgi:hypothetical protein
MYHSDTIYAHAYVCSLVDPKGRRRTSALGGVSYGYVVMLSGVFSTKAGDAGSSRGRSDMILVVNRDNR